MVNDAGGATARLVELGITLPPAQPVHGHHTAVLIDGDLVYTSSVLAAEGDPPHLAWPGRVGAELSLEDGRASARAAMLALLGNVQAAVGDLDRIERFLKLTGYVCVSGEFDKVHFVVGAASDLLADIFGAERSPARAAVGVERLPAGASVALDAIIRLRPKP